MTGTVLFSEARSTLKTPPLKTNCLFKTVHLRWGTAPHENETENDLNKMQAPLRDVEMWFITIRGNKLRDVTAIVSSSNILSESARALGCSFTGTWMELEGNT